MSRNQRRHAIGCQNNSGFPPLNGSSKLNMHSPWGPRSGYTLGSLLFSLTASPTNHNIFVPTSQLPSSEYAQAILDFVGKGQKHAYKKNNIWFGFDRKLDI